MTRLWRAWIGSMPPLLRPHMRALAASVAFAIAVVPISLWLARSWGAVAVPAGIILPQVLDARLNRRRRRLIREALETADGLLCGMCGHNLRHLHEAGACPECGTEYRIERLRSFWRRMSVQFDPRNVFGLGWPTVGPPPVDPPSAIKRSQRGFAAARAFGFAPIIIMLLVVVIIRPPGGMPLFWLMFASFATFFAASAAIQAAQSRATARLVQRAIDADFALCPRCAGRLAEDGACAYCGRRHDLLVVRERWDQHLPLHWDAEMNTARDLAHRAHPAEERFDSGR